LASDPLAWPIHYSGELDAAGVGVPNGSCLLDAKLYFSNLVAGTLGGGPSCLIPRTMGDYSTRALIGGTITATRGPYPVTSNYCRGPCVYTATGSQHILIAPVAGDLIFRSSWSTQSGKALFLPLTPSNYYVSVRFQEFTSPSGLTLKPLLRTWKKADATLTGNRTDIMECPNGNYQANPPTYPGLVCDINVKESGMMTSLTRINGVEHTDTATIYCWETEPLLNFDKVRQGLLAVLDSSHAGDSNPLNRYELQFLILKDTVTPGAEPYLFIMPKSPSANVCWTNAFMPAIADLPPNTRIVAQGHDHPSEPNITVNCKDKSGNSFSGKTANGAEKPDRVFADSVNSATKYPEYAAKGWQPMPSFVIDKHNLFRQLPGQKLGKEKKGSNKVKWDKGFCAWPKRSI
jgi:hypothetical protein